LNGDCLKKLTIEWGHVRESVAIIRLFGGDGQRADGNGQRFGRNGQ